MSRSQVGCAKSEGRKNGGNGRTLTNTQYTIILCHSVLGGISKVSIERKTVPTISLWHNDNWWWP